MREHILQVDAAKCIGCGLCRQDCPANNIFLKDRKAVMATQNCIKCGHCVAICPKAAVSMTGFDEPPHDIAEPARLNPDQLLEALRARRTIRQYRDQPVPSEIVARIIEAGRLTPTGENAQNVSYIVLQDEREKQEKIAVRFFRKILPVTRLFYPAAKNMTIDDDFFLKKAPLAILVLSKDKVNGALAASNMSLMAEACGLGVLYSGFFTIAANYSKALRKELHLNHDKVVTTLVLGYSSVTYQRAAQKDPAVVRRM